MKFGLSGRFELTLKQQDGLVKQVNRFDNLILDSGLDLLATDYSLSYLHIGAGNTEPNVKQVNLVSWLNSVSRYDNKEVKHLDGDVKYIEYTSIFRIPAGTEYNIAEIGISNDSNKQQPLFCRTLVKDETGKAIVLTKLADEILEVSYTLRLVIPHQDVTGVCTIAGEQYHYTVRPAKLDSNNSDFKMFASGELEGITSIPNTNNGFDINISSNRKNYVKGSYRREISLTAGIDQANFSSGVRSAVFLAIFNRAYQVEYRKVSDGSAIAKDNTKTLTLNFAYSWGRAE